jgi:hypothetical protein
MRRLALIVCATLSIGWLYAQDTTIVAIEYFVDDDPGYGSGTSVSLTSGTQVTVSNLLINTSAMDIGFHQLFFRAQDEHGKWGIAQQRLYYVDGTDATGRLVDELEYFFDDDPGYGNGMLINSFTPGTDITESTLISSASLSTGFHTLFFRVRSGSEWGIVEQRLVFVDLQDATTVLVDSLEYFFDDDPGYGQGTILDAFTPANQLTDAPTLAASSLPTGFHTLFIRAKADGGAWGIPEQRLVFVNKSDPGVVLVDSLEYFFDVDPGYGQGNILDGFSAANQLTNAPTLVASSLSIGFHTLFLRAKAEGGAWGIPEQRLVFVNQLDPGAVLVDSLEYFFDADPGYGQGTILDAFTPANQLTDAPILAASALSIGFHTLYIRAKAEGGAWGIPEQRLVFVDQSGNAGIVDQAEYFFDTDPGYGNGTLIDTFTPADAIQIAEVITTNALSPGFHKLFIRARHEGGAWGIPEQRLVYLDDAGSVFTDIVEVEYFYDVDPGYGAGTSIPASDSLSMVDFHFQVATSSLSEGQHVLHVRAKNENGEWGALESFSFSAFGPGRELDSASLRVVYEHLDGANWSNTSNWLSGSLDTWHGVTMTNNRVDTLNLAGNQLSGKLPFQLGYLNAMTQLDLSNNQISDTVPLTFEELQALEDLKLYANELHFPVLLSDLPA